MNSKIRIVVFVLVLITVVSSIAYLQSLSGVPITSSSGFEFAGITNWINSEPLTMQALRGKIILVDFWTYSCINCIRTLPYLVAWNEKYSKYGFVIVGVHSPEFVFEKNLGNVKDAVQKFNIGYPVALDNDHLTFSGFGNRFWPHKYLFDARGNLRYDHIGEGGYEETEKQIQKLLVENGANISNIPVEPENKYANVDLGAAVEGMSNEMYAIRDIINTDGPNIEGRKAVYKDDRNHRVDGIYLNGQWMTSADYMLSTGSNSSFVISYSGRTASPVIGSPLGQKLTAKVLLDGNLVPRTSAGIDLKFDQDGSSYVEISGHPRLYSLVNAKIPFGKHEIRVETDTGLAIWSVTFGA